MAEREIRFIPKKTAVAGRIPTGTTGTESNYIQQGELALNTADRKLYSFDGTNVFEIGAPFTGGSVNNLFSTGSTTGSSGYFTSLTGVTIYSGSTDLSTIIRNSVDLSNYSANTISLNALENLTLQTHDPGATQLKIDSWGGNLLMQSSNGGAVDIKALNGGNLSLSIDNSGGSIKINGLVTSLSASSIYSGSTNLNDLFARLGGSGSSPLTTKGDLYTHNGTGDTRLGVHSNENLFLMPSSGETTGLIWKQPKFYISEISGTSTGGFMFDTSNQYGMHYGGGDVSLRRAGTSYINLASTGLEVGSHLKVNTSFYGHLGSLILSGNAALPNVLDIQPNSTTKISLNIKTPLGNTVDIIRSEDSTSQPLFRVLSAGTVIAANGSVSQPAYSFSGATNWGMYYNPSENGIALAISGVRRMNLSSSELNVYGNVISNGTGTFSNFLFVNTTSGGGVGGTVSTVSQWEGANGYVLRGSASNYFGNPFVYNNSSNNTLFKVDYLGAITSSSLTGSSRQFVQVTSGGTLTAFTQFVTGSTIQTQLEDTSNWDINGIYTGSSISGALKSQMHYDTDYLFVFVDDSTPIRLIRG